MSERVTFRQIADHLQGRIRAGEFPPGGRVPSYRGLSVEYECSVSTVQKGVTLLEDRDVVVGCRGVGVFVQRRRA